MAQTLDNIRSEANPPTLRYGATVAFWLVAMFAVTYLAPSVVEYVLKSVVGLWGTLAIEDLTGCVILGLYWGPPRALLLYGSLKVAELLLVRFGRISLQQLTYIGDIIPAVIILTYVAIFAFRLRPDRSDIDRAGAQEAPHNL